MHLKGGRLMYAIESANLSKSYRDRERGVIEALKPCNIKVESGENIGFIGLNGAGKSTTIKLLTGIMAPTTGEALIHGVNSFKNRREVAKDIGVLFGQRSNLVYDLPVIDSYKLLKAIYEIPNEVYNRNLKLLDEYINLEELLNVPVRKMSLGQRMRCEVASILLHSPRVVFFDEAFLGIDFYSKKMIRDLLDKVNREYNTTFFITSHDINDISKICESVIVVDKGNIIIQDEIQNVVNRSKWVSLKVQFVDEVNFENSDFKLIDIDESTNSYEFKILREHISKSINDLSQVGEIIKYEIKSNTLEEIVENIHLEGYDE